MSKKTSKGIYLYELIITIIIIAILFFTLTTALDILEIVEVPENLSLAKYFNLAVDTSEEIVSDAVDVISQGKLIEDRTGDKTDEELIDLSDINYQEPISSTSLLNVNDCYYSQLNDSAKKMYSKIYANKENLKTGTYVIDFGDEFNSLLSEENGANKLETAFQAALNALIYDKPELFYIDITKMYLYTETTTYVVKKTYKVSIGPENGASYLSDSFNNKQEVDQAISLIDKKIEDLEFIVSGSDYNKAKIIHDYLIENIEYDQSISMPNIYNIYGAFVNGKCVCEGYAKAFKYIMDKLGIDCIFVFGVATNSKGTQENHAWNYVEISGNLYAIDVTWDDPIVIGGGILSDSNKYKYFLKGSNEFFTDHKEDGRILDGISFVYPSISVNNY